MEDTGKKNLMKINKKLFFSSFNSITEKQEENNSNSISESNVGKQFITDNSKKNFIKNGYNENKSSKSIKNIFKQKSEKSLNKLISNSKKSSFSNINKEENNKKNLKLKIKTFYKSSSLQNDNFIFNKLKTIEENNLRNSFKNSYSNITYQIFKKINFNRKRSQIYPGYSNIFNNKLISFFNSNSFSTKSILKNKSLNLSSSTSSNIKFHKNKSIKKEIILDNKRININNQNNNILSIDLINKLKISPLYYESEIILKKEKILYSLLVIFTLLSIILKIYDTFLYNKKSLEYLKNNNMNNKYNNIINNITNNINNFNINKIINKIFRKKDKYFLDKNLNIVFSIICSILVLIIYNIRNKLIKQTNKNNLDFFSNYNNNYLGYKKRKNKIINEDKHIRIIPNNNYILTQEKIPRFEIIITVISFIINMIFYPPLINKVFIKINRGIVHAYSLNTILLIFTFLKLVNLYRAIIYLSPLNNLMYRIICKSRMVNKNFLFMLRYYLNRYPLIFIFSSFFLLGLLFCILIFCIEYFSIDTINGIWNNKGDNNLRNYFNIIYLLSFYIIKNISGEISPKTILGMFILIIGGTIGLFIFSYFIYYINELVRISPEENKAYSKLIKILNPLNDEHKSANLIKIVLLMKKTIKNYKNIEKDYRINKKENLKIFFNHFKKKKNNFIFEPNDIDNSFTSKLENNIYIEKNKFKNYLYIKFILKVRLITECKNFKNDLFIARNFSHSFTDLIKTLGNKMDENLHQLNIKLELLLKIEKNYDEFKKYHVITSKKINKIIEYQQFIFNYLMNKQNNDNYENYLVRKKEIRMKGTISGTNINYQKKLIKKKFKKKYNKFYYPITTRKRYSKTIKYPIYENGAELNFDDILKTNTFEKKSNNKYCIFNKRKSLKSKSIDNNLYININFIKKTDINERRNSSYTFKNNNYSFG